MTKEQLGTESRRVTTRVQLLYTLAVGGREAMVEDAVQAGYFYRPRRVTSEDRSPFVSADKKAGEPAESARRIAPEPKTPDLEPLRFWRPVEREYREDLEGRALPPAAASTDESVRPEDLESGNDGGRIRLEPIAAWPRLWRSLEDRLRTPRPRRAIDVERLVASWSRGEAVHTLPRRLGRAHAPLLVMLDSSDRLMPFWQDQLAVLGRLAKKLGRRCVRRVDARALLQGPLPVLGAEERILALTDLGSFSSVETRNAWARLGTRLKRCSVAAPVALVSAPRAVWPGSVGSLWQAVEWEYPNGRGAATGRTAVESERLTEAVLCLASVAQRLETGLVRNLRRLAGGDVGVEVALWRHEDVSDRSADGLVLDVEAAKRRRRAFDRLDATQKTDVARVLERWHGAMPEILAAELVDLTASTSGSEEDLLGDSIDRSQALLARICRRVARDRDQDDGFEHAVDAWFARFSQWSSSPLWREPRLRGDLEGATKALRERYPETQLPPAPTSEMLAVAHSGKSPPHLYSVVQCSDGIAVENAHGTGSPLAQVLSRSAPELGAAKHEPTSAGLVHLTTDIESISLEAWQPVLDDTTSWASAAGRDEFGLWAAFEVGGVRQRLRWIPPGRFWMGSPKQEPSRRKNEGPRHAVMLTEGFWLAETPCTQAMWRAVLGEEPSKFDGDERPVETVSWNDCQRFMERLNQRFRHLDARLPTEAEWEYACRAGTETATWIRDPDLAGAGGSTRLDRIAWYQGNSAHETHDVATKEPNPWGVYDPLGNVWEWCWDRKANYSAKSLVDPEGAAEGSMRVFRGGSWDDRARSVRAACRYWIHPVERASNLGFRLSRGRRPGARGAELGSAASEAARRGTSLRARSRRSRAWVERLGWATDGGTDTFGRWASFEIGGVVTKLRWICPGSFHMGSPAEEAGRYHDEGPRHLVTLTEGFWLAATPCTQALWEAVTGSNPSEFRTPHRPVENVSWDDVEAFLAVLAERVPGLVPRLPTEAWWEYACRAGTESGTWLGDVEILGERNAPRLDSIAWYGGNSGVGFDLVEGRDSSTWDERQYPHTLAGTHEVALKQPNPWGLFDMLGNVWEWCSDPWESGYSGEPRTDPEGPEEGPGRVFRGGSWFARARGVRAACRNWIPPDERGSDLGFRLSRGRGE